MSDWKGSAVAGTASAYCARSDIDALFGSDNVDKWADLNNNEDVAEIALRVARAIEIGSTRVNDGLKDGPFVIPFTSVPVSIVNAAAQFAGVWLYESRGVDDADKDGKHRLSYHKKDATDHIRKILAGVVILDATRTSGNAPSARATTTTQEDLIDAGTEILE